MAFIDCSDTQEHEYNRFGRTAEHLHCILYCRMRLVRYVRLYVILHSYAAEGNSVMLNTLTIIKKCVLSPASKMPNYRV